MIDDHARVADGLAATGIGAYILTVVAEVTPILQALALVVSVVAGGFAAYYHYKKIKEMRR